MKLTREAIIEMAKKVGSNGDGFETRAMHITQLEAFAAEVIEMCAKVCEETDVEKYRFGGSEYEDGNATLGTAAKAIRALSPKKGK